MINLDVGRRETQNYAGLQIITNGGTTEHKSFITTSFARFQEDESDECRKEVERNTDDNKTVEMIVKSNAS